MMCFSSRFLCVAASFSACYHRRKEQGMIELTHNQWRAIAQEPNLTLTDPESRMAYVLIRKDEYEKVRMVTETEPDAAYVVRIAWRRRMGLDKGEIAESIRDDPPVNVQEEMKQLKALDSLDKITPPAESLRKHATRY
jgi:hypothetical protein